MCTLSIIRAHGWYRLVFNRDEQRSRAEALPPSLTSHAGRTIVFPTDPVSGGTWISANDLGISVCLLNSTRGQVALAGTAVRSRGGIAPMLSQLGSLSAMTAAAEQLEATVYPPFRLVLAGDEAVVTLASDGRQVRVIDRSTDLRPYAVASSGLGDDLVESARLSLFGRLLDEHAHESEAQDALHTHRWADRPHLSALMSRPDARTMSRSIVEVDERRVSMTYHAVDEQGGVTSASSLSFQRQGTRAAPEDRREPGH